MDIRELLRENIRTLAPYSTARDEYQGELGIYLDANENPYDNNYNRYPDPHQKNLKRRLAEIKGVPVEKIFIGNGSDEPIDLVFRLFCEPRRHNAVSIAPTYGMYKVAAAINDVQMREVQLEPGFTLDAEKLLAATDENTRLLFLCSPNNPSGNCFPKKEIEKVIRRFNGIVILDEAYIDFAGQPGFLSELDEYPNLVILQTLSKAWGMAGLRLGLAFAQPLIVDTLSRVKYPYNINVVTQKIVLEQLRKSPDAQIAEIVSERGRVLEGLAKNPVIRKIHPTDANFILVEVDEPRTIYDRLIGAGIIVRDRSRIKGCEGCLRITIGTPEDLALEGHLSGFFARKGIVFDMETGLFRVENQYSSQVQLVGHGQKYAMARKALQRNGILANRNVVSDICVETGNLATPGFSICRDGKVVIEAKTIEELLEQLKVLF